MRASGIDWRPSQYVARGEMPNGISWAVWVEDQTEMVKGDGQPPWYWKTEVFMDGAASEAHGRAETSEKAMRSAWDGLERLVYAFCTPAAEDWPLRLSSLLAAAETAVRAQEKGPLKWPDDETFKEACEAARNLLAHVPRGIP